MSCSVISIGPYGLPVPGLMLAGAVEPYDEPSMLDETTKYARCRSSCRDRSDHPTSRFRRIGGVLPAAHVWLPVQPCVTRIALRRSATEPAVRLVGKRQLGQHAAALELEGWGL